MEHQEAREILQRVRAYIKETRALTDLSFNTWFEPLNALACVGDVFYCEAPNAFVKNHLLKTYNDLFLAALQQVTQKKWRLMILLPEEKDQIPLLQNDLPKNNFKSVFTPRYTFKNFVVGSSNRFAHAAAAAVAEAPSEAYNPLFIYGKSGLGKTHLLQAIGHYIAEYFPEKNILYVSGETFTNELVAAISSGKNQEFRNRYRCVDVLMLDDVQFIAGKASTEEEMFHTFNALHGDKKQIILASDRPPREIVALEDRLRTRFEWGLIADIQVPDIDTRVAILRKKAEAENVVISNKTLYYIAEKVKTNIRELEGSLSRLLLYANLNGKSLTEDVAEEALKDILPPDTKEKKLTVEMIQEQVQNYFKLRPGDLTSQKRSKDIAFPRHVAMYLCRELLSLSFPQIGENFGRRDHTTVLYACEKVEDRMRNDVHIRNIIENLKEQIMEN